MEISLINETLFAGARRSGVPFPERKTKICPIDLNQLIQNPDATILVRHKGLSMINAFIPPDALLIIDQSIDPQNNSIVLASINGTLIVRYLQKNDYKSKLVPANSKFPEIEITAVMNFTIIGVVTQTISDPGKLKTGC